MKKNDVNGKAVIYCRVSSKSQGEGYSLAAQAKLCMSKASDLELEVVKTFSCYESSFKPGRKTFREMLNYVIENEIKNIISLGSDRLEGRNDYDCLELRELESQGAIKIHYVFQNFSDNATGRFGKRVTGAANRYLSEAISEKVKISFDEKLEKGEWCFNAPYGYKHSKALRNIEHDPRESENVRWFFQEYASGRYSLELLRQEFTKTGRIYHFNHPAIPLSHLHRLLTNPIYYGDMCVKDRIFKGKYKPIISRSLFAKVEEVLGRANKPCYTRNDFTFGGLLTCGQCGCKITGERHEKKSGLVFQYYRCANGRKFHQKGELVYVSEKEIDGIVSEFLKKLEKPGKYYHAFQKTLEAIYHEEFENMNDRIENLERKKSKIQNWQDQAYMDKLEGVISEEVWNGRYVKWSRELEEIESQLTAFDGSGGHSIDRGSEILELSQSLYSCYIQQDSAGKREIVQTVLLNPCLDGYKVHSDWKKPFNWMVEIGDERNMGG